MVKLTDQSSIFGGIMRDCLLRLEKIQEARDCPTHEIDMLLGHHEPPQKSGVDELSKKLEEINRLIDQRSSLPDENERSDPQNIKIANTIRHKLLELEQDIESASKSEARTDGAIASLFRPKLSSLQKVEKNQQEFHLKNLRKALEAAKENFFSTGSDGRKSLKGVKIKRMKLRTALEKSPVKYTASRKVLGEMENSPSDNARAYASQLEAIKANERQIDSNIDYLILEARNLADYGRALGDEVHCQTEMLISSSEQASKSVSKISTLKKRLENILSEKSRQNLVLSTALMLVFLGLVGYLVYELVTFFA